MEGVRNSKNGGSEVAGKKQPFCESNESRRQPKRFAQAWVSCTKLGLNPDEFQVPGLAVAGERLDRVDTVSLPFEAC